MDRDDIVVLGFGEGLKFRRTLRVRTTIQQVTGLGLIIKRTKSRASDRVIHLPGVVVRSLVARRDIQSGEGHASAEYIFTSPTGRLYSPSKFRVIFYRMRERAGVPKVRLHDLRHGAATTALSNGVPLAAVSKLLGHASINITLKTYIHLMPDTERQAADKLDEIWG